MSEKKILWVEDDEDLVLSFQPSLEEEGWKVQAAFTVEEAKTTAAKAELDLIIMDIIMQAQHGYRVIEDLRNYPHLANVPIIIFSNLSEKWGETTATREDFLLSDAAEFVNKSGGRDVLIKTIHKYLGTNA